MTCLLVMSSLSILYTVLLVAGDTDNVQSTGLPPRSTIIGRSPADSVTRPSKSTVRPCHSGLFQYPGNLPELSGLTPVLVRKRTANPAEVVATPVTEML